MRRMLINTEPAACVVRGAPKDGRRRHPSNPVHDANASDCADTTELADARKKHTQVSGLQRKPEANQKTARNTKADEGKPKPEILTPESLT
ncbi:MAG: hypothetical protein Q8L69_05570 [Gallionellaceae bacterium]|nr:hypothetical protein [Gallionellaceae bacterium]